MINAPVTDAVAAAAVCIVGCVLACQETKLSGSASESTSVVDKQLPRGDSASNAITIVVHVADVHGASTRSLQSSSGGACIITVVPYVLNTANLGEAIADLAASSAARLSDALSAGDTSQFLNSLAVLSSVVSAPVDACAGVSCGLNGTCFSGVCLCDAGYSGDFCETAPVPVNGAYTEWANWTRCSMSCGGGLRSRSRECQPPLFGGAPCSAVGPATETEVCNQSPCVVKVDGGWSEWSSWSMCSNKCPDDKGGDYSGVQHRGRLCDNPPRSPDGAPCVGNTSEVQSCNTQLCVPWVKRCPGSSDRLAADPNPLRLPQIECSGHGTCVREPDQCREGEPCAAVCICDGEWGSSDCSRSQAVMDSIIAMRKEHLQMQAQAMASADLSNPAAVIQQAQTLASIARPDELVPESRNAMLNMVDTLVSGGSSNATSTTPLQPSAGSVLLGVVGGAVFSSIQTSQIASAQSSGRLLSTLAHRVQRMLSTNATAAQEDAKHASEHMSGIVRSISGSIMRGAVSGEEPVVVSSSMVSLSVARVGSDSTAGASLSSPGGSSIGVTSTITDQPMDIRAVSWTNNPVRWEPVCWLGCWVQSSGCYLPGSALLARCHDHAVNDGLRVHVCMCVHVRACIGVFDWLQHGWSPGSAGLKTAVVSFEFAFENGTVKSVHDLLEPLTLTITVPPYVLRWQQCLCML